MLGLYGRMLRLCALQKPLTHPTPFLYPAHAAAAFVETASFCERIAHEDSAIATDVRAHITELGCPATLWRACGRVRSLLESTVALYGAVDGPDFGLAGFEY